MKQLVDVRGAREAFNRTGLWEDIATAGARPALDRLQLIADVLNGFARPPEGLGTAEYLCDVATGVIVAPARRGRL